MLNIFVSKYYIFFFILWDEAFSFLLSFQIVHSGPVTEKEFMDIGSAVSHTYPPHYSF